MSLTVTPLSNPYATQSVGLPGGVFTHFEFESF